MQRGCAVADPIRFRVGERKSEAVAAAGLIFVSGQVCPGAEGKDTEQQTAEILAAIDGILAETGTDKSRIVSSTVWLRDIGEIADMNQAWQSWIVPGSAPARATVQAALGGPHYRVEIAVVALA